MSRSQMEYRIRLKNDVYYYKLPEMKSFKTTNIREHDKKAFSAPVGRPYNTKARREAVSYVENIIARTNGFRNGDSVRTLREYAKDYFVVEIDKNTGNREVICPRLRRLESEGHKPVSDRYIEQERYNLTKFILPSFLGGKLLCEITRRDIILFRESLQNNGKTSGVINGAVGTLYRIFAEAVFREDIRDNPAAGFRNLIENPREIEPYSWDDYKKLFPLRDKAKLKYIWGRPVHFILEFILATTGMRLNEATALKWRDIHWQENYIEIRQSFKNVERTILGLPKNGHTRKTALSETLKEVLSDYYQNATKFTAPDDFVCCGTQGKVISKKSTYRHHSEALKRAGIKGRKTFHTHRHTFNSHLQDAQVSAGAIRTVCGWSGEQIQNRYTHKNEVLHAQSVGESFDKMWNEEFMAQADKDCSKQEQNEA